jgi:hypothetical protein
MSQKLNAAIAVIGIDIGKNSFHTGHDHCGRRHSASPTVREWSTARRSRARQWRNGQTHQRAWRAGAAHMVRLARDASIQVVEH